MVLWLNKFSVVAHKSITFVAPYIARFRYIVESITSIRRCIEKTHTCGALSLSNVGQSVVLSGWVQKRRSLGSMSFVDIRDRYGITQLSFSDRVDKDLHQKATKLAREYVIKAEGVVIERECKNRNMPTGDIEVSVQKLTVLNTSEVPPFTIEDRTDGGDDLRMQYRYLDIRRNPVKENLLLRHRVAMLVRNYLSNEGFVEVETPYLIKSTPEGARDFVVPSRMNQGQFYALPQSPQTFKQLLMVGGMDKYFQIVKCFRDEDLRADRQPEFTQIDCEMSFVEQEDVLCMFEGMLKYLLKQVKGIDLVSISRITYNDAIRWYGTDKPDIRFGMRFVELHHLLKGRGFRVFDDAEIVVGLCVEGGASYTRKQIDKLVDWVKRPQVGANGMVWVKCNGEDNFKSSVDKFFSWEDLRNWADAHQAKAGDLLLAMAGDTAKTRKALGELRLKLGDDLGLRDTEEFAPLWVVDFPLLEWNDDAKTYHAMHHPFTSAKQEDKDLLDSNPQEVKANAYDLVLNGNEIGGGSVRIYDANTQQTMFKHLGFSQQEAKSQFGFLMEAFKYGAPPHAGIAFGLDRLVALLAGQQTIRDFIAFPKNNSGRDIMINTPAELSTEQLEELSIKFGRTDAQKA